MNGLVTESSSLSSSSPPQATTSADSKRTRRTFLAEGIGRLLSQTTSRVGPARIARLVRTASFVRCPDGETAPPPAIVEIGVAVQRRGPESNRRIAVLQTAALPLGYRADEVL